GKELVLVEFGRLQGGLPGVVPAAALEQHLGAAGQQVSVFGVVLEGKVERGQGVVVTAGGLKHLGQAERGGNPGCGLPGEGRELLLGLGVVASQQARPRLLEGRTVGPGNRGGRHDQAGTEKLHRRRLARASYQRRCYISRRRGQTQGGGE